jgi:ABC-2 type transport system permease protein
VKAFWQLSRMRVFDVVRSPVATLLFLGVPVAILLVLAAVFAHGHPFETKTVLLVGDADVGKKLERFHELGLEREASSKTALLRLQSAAASAVLSRAPQGGISVLVSDKEQLLGRGLREALGEGTTLTALAVPRSAYLSFVFPGFLASSVMFAGLFSMGYAMARYRQNHFLKKLATTPLRRGTFVTAQVSGRGLLVLLQVAVLTAVATILFELSLGPAQLLAAAVLSLLGLVVFCGLGFVIATAIRTEAVVNDVISALGLPLALLSGIFFPLSALPQPLRVLCELLPSTLLVDTLRATLLFDASLLAVAPSIALLGVWGLLAFLLSLSLFRWHAA